MFEIGKTYKVQDLQGTYYTATILEEDANLIYFVDLHGLKQHLAKQQIKRAKEIIILTEAMP